MILALNVKKYEYFIEFYFELMFSIILSRGLFNCQDDASFLVKSQFELYAINLCRIYIRKLKQLFQLFLPINCFSHPSINKEALTSETNI